MKTLIEQFVAVVMNMKPDKRLKATVTYRALLGLATLALLISQCSMTKTLNTIKSLEALNKLPDLIEHLEQNTKYTDELRKDVKELKKSNDEIKEALKRNKIVGAAQTEISTAAYEK